MNKNGPADTFLALKQNIAKIFVGKTEHIELILTGFLSGLHVLLEDIPGVGKTTLSMALARSSGSSFLNRALLCTSLCWLMR